MRTLNHTPLQNYSWKGVAVAISRKQKLNTKNSIEFEFEGVDDASGQIIWTNYCIDSLRNQLNCMDSTMLIRVLFCWRKMEKSQTATKLIA